ncbi:hypothetical protein BT96DRAFT_563985 [Gymnopus androsaceus JB14]|uniref:Uncharacterized protein n=1 Tax=Gymnopus androsaceus JB14 TaxID=1447944 RepID=A0A6A4HWZ9_9AGAR|nr:hypothetical protein BT96DRAFT_563985 [Gymnopus androsaceus JB14]
MDTATVVHGDIVRDGKPRRKDEWEKFSDDLLGASTVTSTTHAAFPSSPPPMFPPPSREAQYKNPFASWFLDLFDCSARDRHETLDFCVKDFTRLCGNLPEEEWEEVIRREIMFNLSRMAVCRGFREELRRFVVVTGDKDKYLGSDSGGFEWVTAEAFRFHDEADGMEL